MVTQTGLAGREGCRGRFDLALMVPPPPSVAAVELGVDELEVGVEVAVVSLSRSLPFVPFSLPLGLLLSLAAPVLLPAPLATPRFPPDPASLAPALALPLATLLSPIE